LLHALLLLIPIAGEKLLPKSYAVIDAVPLYFEEGVESEIVGEKSSKGDLKAKRGTFTTSLPFGDKSRWKPQRLEKVSSLKESEAEFPLKSKPGRVGNTGSYKSNSAAGRGGSRDVRLSVRVFDVKEEKEGELPSVSYDELASYIRKVRNKIEKSWTPPPGSKGATEISLSISRSGEIKRIEVKRISKDAELNRSAVDAIYGAAPFGSFPASSSREEVKVRVRFEVR